MFAYKGRVSNKLTNLFSQVRMMLTARAVVFSKHGDPKEALSTHQYEIDDEKLGAETVLVRTLGAPVNPSDINQVQGVYPSQPEKTKELGTAEPSAVGGNEGLFEVLKVGSKVTGFLPGDWCVPSTVNMGTWRTHLVAPEEKFLKLPNPEQSKSLGKAYGLTVNQGATISVNPLTAYFMLLNFRQLSPGKDWFIQNGGNSAVGKLATQIGRILGVNSISVVRDRPNVGLLEKELKEEFGATKVITDTQSSSRDFSAEVKSWVKNTGGEVKVALNCVGGQNATDIARKLSPNGIIVTYGGMSMQPVSIPPSLYIFKNITSCGFWVTQFLKQNPDLKEKIVADIVKWYENGELKDAPSVEVKFDGSGDLASFVIEAIANSKQGKHLITF